MYWNILVWLRIEIPDGFLHQISENLKIDDLVTGGTINLQLTLICHEGIFYPFLPMFSTFDGKMVNVVENAECF